jgi:Family of unknown function (DUF5681)
MTSRGSKKSSRKKQPYTVGYGKPPARHRFKPGQSGNPKGRPKQLPELADLMAKELRRRGLVTIDGKQQSITRLELIVKNQVNLAGKGHPKSLGLLIDLLGKIEAKQRKQAVLGRGTTIHGGMTAKEAAEEYARWIKETHGDEDYDD